MNCPQCNQKIKLPDAEDQWAYCRRCGWDQEDAMEAVTFRATNDGTLKETIIDGVDTLAESSKLDQLQEIHHHLGLSIRELIKEKRNGQ